MEGNNMKVMKEALEAIADSARTGSISQLPSATLVLRTCEIALAAPPRNCDVYDKEEVRMAYHLQGDGLMTMQAVVDWLYSAKKRGDESPRTEQESEVKS